MNYSLTKFAKSVMSLRTFLLNASAATNKHKFPDTGLGKAKKQYGACHERRIAFILFGNEEDRLIIDELMILSNTVL
jgi:hypothetical protein